MSALFSLYKDFFPDACFESASRENTKTLLTTLETRNKSCLNSILTCEFISGKYKMELESSVITRPLTASHLYLQAAINYAQASLVTEGAPFIRAL